MKKTKKMLKTEEKFGEKIESLLERMYAKERKTTIEIGNILGVGNATAGRWLKTFSIDIRSSSESRWPDNTSKNITREGLERLYVVEGRSMFDISRIYETSQRTIFRKLREFNIKTRDYSESRLPKDVVKPDKKQLLEWVREGKSTSEIAEILGINVSTALRWLKKEGLETKEIDNPLYNSKENRKKITDRLLKIFEKSPEDLTFSDFDSRPRKKLGMGYTPLLSWYKKNYNLESYVEAIKVLVEDIYGTKLGSINDLAFRKRKVNELLGRLGKLPEELSTHDFNNKKLDNSWYYHRLLTWYQKENNCNTGEALDHLLLELFNIEKRRVNYDDKFNRLKLMNELLSKKNKSSKELTTTDFHEKQEERRKYRNVLEWYKDKCHCKDGDALDILLRDLYKVKRENKRKSYDDRSQRKQITDNILKELDKGPEELTTTDFSSYRKIEGRSYQGLISWYERQRNCKSKEALDFLLEDLYGIQRKSNSQQLENLLKDYIEER